MLYSVGRRFCCRARHSLAYASTREAPWQRARRRAEGIRARLAGTRTFPEKPRGMRWSTYERLRQELDAAEGHAFGGFVARHEGLIARLEREPNLGR